MDSQLVTPKQARATARALFTRMHRDQEAWFDLAWEHITKTAPDVFESPTVDQVTSLVPNLGATGAADELTRRMARQFAELAATFLIHSPVARSELLKKLQKGLAKSGQPDALVEWLVRSATQTLEQLSIESKLFLTTLLNGKIRRNQWCDREDLIQKLKQQRFDVIINEDEHEIRVNARGGIPPSAMRALSPMHRGMLWLALIRVGGLIYHKDIGELFNVDVTEPRADAGDVIGGRKSRVLNKVYQYPVALRETLGNELYSRVIGTGMRRSNEVIRDGWSFIWARKMKDEWLSELLDDIREFARSRVV